MSYRNLQAICIAHINIYENDKQLATNLVVSKKTFHQFIINY